MGLRAGERRHLKGRGRRGHVALRRSSIEGVLYSTPVATVLRSLPVVHQLRHCMDSCRRTRLAGGLLEEVRSRVAEVQVSDNISKIVVEEGALLDKAPVKNCCKLHLSFVGRELRTICLICDTAWAWVTGLDALGKCIGSWEKFVDSRASGREFHSMTTHRWPVYLLHFGKPLAHARHYLGTALDVGQRFDEHVGGSGSPLVRAVVAAGIPVVLARVWKRGGRTFERRLKRGKNVPRLCPICCRKAGGSGV